LDTGRHPPLDLSDFVPDSKAMGANFLCKGCFCFGSFAWAATNAIMAMWYLSSVHFDFMDILDSIPDPQVRIVRHPDYSGPVNIICAPSIVANHSNTTCDDVFAEFEQVSTTQMYFSWLYLQPPPTRSNPNSPIYTTTVDDMKSGRFSLYILLAIGVFSDLVYQKGIFKFIGLFNEQETDCSQKAISAAVALLNAIFGINICHMFLCNLFSVSEYEAGLFLLQYIPAWGYWAFVITIFCTVCVCATFAVIVQDEDVSIPCLVFAIVIIYILWGISQFGLYVYIWNFNLSFSAKSVENAIIALKPEYPSSVDTLRRISIAVGAQGLFAFVEHLVHLL